MNSKIKKPDKLWEKWNNKEWRYNKILCLIKDNKNDKLGSIEK